MHQGTWFLPCSNWRSRAAACLCQELSALVPDRLEGPWSEEEVRELIQGWRMMAFCQEDEPVRAHPFHSADGLFRTVVFDTCPA
jgi:hypothetical protein